MWQKYWSKKKKKLTEISLFEHKSKCRCYYTVFIALTVIFLTTSIGNGAYFVYYKYVSRNKENISLYNYQSYKMGVVKQIDIKNRTYYFYNDILILKILIQPC